MVARRTVGGLRGLEAAALVTAAGLVSYALAAGLAHRHYDVDEIQHTHVMWRISVGDRPFHDFVESHPPFVWYLGAPLLRWTSGPASAIAGFRILAAGAGLVFVGLVLAAARARQPAVGIPWLMGAGLLVLSQRRNLDYFIEARPDSLAYALLFAALVSFLRGHPRPLFARCGLFASLAATALLWTPKLAVLVVAFALADLVARGRQPREVLVAVAGHAAGIGLALAAAIAFLIAAGIDPRLAYDLSIGFHGRFLSTTSFSHGLMHSLGEEPVALGLACAGAVAWVVLALTRHIRPSSFEIAALCYLVTAPLWASLPYKQYYVPWFVLSAVFVPFLGVALHLAGASLARTALAGILVFASVSGGRAARDYGRVDQVAFFRTLWTLTRNAASPEGRVVADPQWHPIYRRDVFYGWFSTYDPRGRGQEVILREWNPRGYGARFTDEGYAREIAAHPPALIVTVGGGFNLPATQENVVARYVRDHGAEYVAVPLAGKLGLLVRRDQANWDYLEAASLARRDEARAGVAASGTTAYHDDFARGTPAAPVGAERDPMRER